MRFSVVLALLTLLGVAAPAVSESAVAARWVSSGGGDAAVRLLVGDGAALISRGAVSTPIELPSSFYLEEIVSTSSGWIAAGTEARKEGRELVLLAEGDGETVRLPPPPGRHQMLRQNPVLLTFQGEFVGMLWLEGRDEMSLRIEYADWQDDGWIRMGRVAGRGPGSQLALDAVILDDGSWIAVWSRFDRRDDEIYWTRRLPEGWQEAQRVSVDNGVPDIVPSLTSLGNEALLAWSRFDGSGYELKIARFDGDNWSDERVVAGNGSLYPSWHATPGSVGLVFRQAASSSWVWIEFDAAGRSLRSSAAPGGSDGRPIPTFENGQAELLFPTGHREAVSWNPIP